MAKRKRKKPKGSTEERNRIPAPPEWLRSENPIRRALAMDEMLRSGTVKNRAEQARMLGIHRSRVTQLLSLLELGDDVLAHLASWYSLPKGVSERWLRGTLTKIRPQNRYAAVLRRAVLSSTDPRLAEQRRSLRRAITGKLRRQRGDG